MRDGRTLRVATYNVLHGLDLPQGAAPDLRTTVAAVRSLAADVVALQEVDRNQCRTGRVDQVAWLAGELGMHGVFLPALHGNPDGCWTVTSRGRPDDDAAYGIGLLSRLAVVNVRSVHLPGGGRARCGATRQDRPGWDHEPRVLLMVELRSDAGRLRVATTHLSYLPWRGLRQLRTCTATLAAEARREAPDTRTIGTILLGDFNLPATACRVLTPGWRHAGGGPTYPSWDPRLQLDQALVRGRLAVHDAAVAAAAGSDHRPLVVTVGCR